MLYKYRNSQLYTVYEILKLGVKNQILLSYALDLKHIPIMRELKQIDRQLICLLMQYKAESRYYIWHTQGDDKVRPEHAANDGQIFDRDNPPPTGNPGDDYGCRCTAEDYINDPPIEPVYPIESALLFFMPLGRLFNAWRAWVTKPDPEWTLGTYKSPQRWANQLEGRDWTPEQITDTIKNGEQFPAPNDINKGNTATRYQTSVPGRYVVMDDITKEIIQVGKEGFNPPVIK